VNYNKLPITCFISRANVCHLMWLFITSQTYIGRHSKTFDFWVVHDTKIPSAGSQKQDNRQAKRPQQAMNSIGKPGINS
jgi:hypothetical protein